METVQTVLLIRRRGTSGSLGEVSLPYLQSGRLSSSVACSASFFSSGVKRPFAVRLGNVKKLKILVFNWHCSLNPEMGGAEVFTYEVANRWN